MMVIGGHARQIVDGYEVPRKHITRADAHQIDDPFQISMDGTLYNLGLKFQ